MSISACAPKCSAVDDALCFGWIDSRANKRDHQSYYQFLPRRNPTINWSKINKEKVEKLTNQVLMEQFN
ncbi:YdeI family protein [Bacteroidota bacterium]